MCLAIMKKGSLRAEGMAIPNKRDVIASQRRGNLGEGGCFQGFSQLKVGYTLIL